MLNPLDLEVIDLEVYVEGGKVINAKSSGNKLRNYEKMFLNKDARSLYNIIPRVLATCAQSHVYAYANAVSSTNLEASKYMVMLEIIESHLRHPYVYWFPYLGGVEYQFPSGQKFARISKLSREIKGLMEKIGGKWPSIDYLSNKKISIRKDEILSIISGFEKEVIGMDLDSFLNLTEISELKGDLKLLKDVPLRRAGIDNYLVIGFPFLGNFNLEYLSDFGTYVLYNGTYVEVGPLAQALTFDKMVKNLHNKYGPSPLLRELSRIRVIAYLLKMFSDLDYYSDEFKVNKGTGIGIVESIRGSLIHKVSIDEDYKVSNYSIIQPTTFNASPGGALEKAVEGIPIDPKNPWELSLAVSSLDSCFVTEVKVYEKDKMILKKRIGGFC
ncbi:nickel-dependent hydrogenase large subunit [Acidianus manzaensis]|uniref:Hydrogenase n=1 Tax=Acidianus manzaensis TaxID=282676 RepID=A0A1W6JYR1_9CREN|nr:nickel-dependent hydrogenase large subunit [Acidianus manzaensis]ARM75350.1 hydrogenase [Acidianus manzaensis]